MGVGNGVQRQNKFITGRVDAKVRGQETVGMCKTMVVYLEWSYKGPRSAGKVVERWVES